MKRSILLCIAALLLLALALFQTFRASATTQALQTIYSAAAPSTVVVGCNRSVTIAAIERSAPEGESTYQASFYALGSGRIELVTPGDTEFVQLRGTTELEQYQLIVHRAANAPTALTLFAYASACGSKASARDSLTVVAPTLFAVQP